VGKLQLDMRVGEAHLVKERGRYAAKSVARHSMLVPKALKRFEIAKTLFGSLAG